MSSEYEMEEDGGADEETNGRSASRVWGNILAGTVIGVVVGGGLALLFAPKSGDEMRADLGSTVDDLKDRAEKVIDDLQGSAADLIARSKAAVDQTRENIVRSVDAGKEAYAQKKEELTSQLDA